MEKNIITPDHTKITIQEMIDEIKSYMSSRPNTKIIVGSDSQKVRKGFCFATCIAAIDPGNGGIFYIKKDYKNPERSLKDVKSTIAWKVWNEAMEICDMMRILIENDIEMNEKITHHDISKAGLSRDHIESIMGFMKSQGFSPEIKPNAVIASGIANAYSKK